jgi:ABC-type multidrug transport system ATPase subunit
LKIAIHKAGKKFNTDWIFRDLTYTFESGHSYAILGRNGSGKSTLLQVVAGSIHPTAGEVSYEFNGQSIPVDTIFRYISCSAPYLELVEEFKLREMMQFHFRFKEILPGYSIEKAIEILDLKGVDHKVIRQYSSGMKQRVKLILAFLSKTPLLLLDEPTTNLDKAGMDWYLNLIGEFTANRTVIICSNLQQLETGFCKETLLIEDYK